MFNTITIMGNLTRDPEVRAVGSTSVAKFGIAANRQFKDKSGKVIQEVCFVDVETWGYTAENCGKYLKKGSRALVEGRLKYETWTDKEGKERSKHLINASSVTFLDRPEKREESETRLSDDESLPEARLAENLLKPQKSQIKPDIQLYGLKKTREPASDIDDELPF